MRYATALLLVLSGCGTGSDGRYAGTATTEQGACGLGFDGRGTARAELLLRGKEAVFVPSDGVLTLNGQVSAAGHVAAAATLPGADHKPFTEVFEGDIKDGRVSGRFATPRCRASVELTRR